MMMMMIAAGKNRDRAAAEIFIIIYFDIMT